MTMTNARALVSLAVLIALPALAHNPEDYEERLFAKPPEEVKQPPHGGQIFIVDAEYKAEVLFSPTGFELWFYDKDMNPTAAPATATTKVSVGKEVRKLELKLDEKNLDRLTGTTPLPTSAKVAVLVDATINGKKRSARVERQEPKVAPTPTTAP